MSKSILPKEQEEFKKCIINAMLDKKASNIVSIDLREIKNSFTDHFVICQGTSRPHVETIADIIEETTIKKYKLKPSHKEGFENKEWILLDYFDIVIHIFLEEKRDFYAIEELWNDGVIAYIDHEPKKTTVKNIKPKLKKDGRKTNGN